MGAEQWFPFSGVSAVFSLGIRFSVFGVFGGFLFNLWLPGLLIWMRTGRAHAALCGNALVQGPRRVREWRLVR
jgi:hypothetical protein